MGEQERRPRAKTTYLASWFIIDALGCLRRGSHRHPGQVLCLELDLQVVSIRQAPKKRGDRVLFPLFQNPTRYQPLLLPPEIPLRACDPETVPSPSCSDPVLSQLLLFLSLDCELLNPPWGHLLSHLAQKRPPFLY